MFHFLNTIAIFLALIFSLLPCSLHGSEKIYYPDFHLSMTRDGKSFKKYENMVAENNSDNSLSTVQFLSLFHNLYIKSILSGKVNLLKNQYRIPRIIHQIWLGNQMPEKYVQWVSSWLRLQGWTYRLWTDRDIDELLLYNRTLYNNSKNYGEKSDILRLELLYHYGGIYVDIDFECINENIFEELHKSYDFYIGFEPLEHGLTNEYNSIKMCNALIGSIPGHPLLRKMIVNMQNNYSTYKNSSPIERTGPDYLSRMIIKYEMQKKKNFYINIYLPCSFFYYISAADIQLYSHYSQLFECLPIETAAIHHWSGSWHTYDANYN